MKRTIRALVGAFSLAVLAACGGGGGDPDVRQGPTAEQAAVMEQLRLTRGQRPAAIAQPSREKAQLCMYGCGGSYGWVTAWSSEDYYGTGGQSSLGGGTGGSAYYGEGDSVVVRFDGTGADQWVEYTLVSQSATQIEIDLRTPSADVPGTFDASTVVFYKQGSIILSDIFALNGTTLVSVEKSASWTTGNLGMKPIYSNTFTGSRKMYELFYDTL